MRIRGGGWWHTGLSTAKHSDVPCHKPILGALAVVIAFNVKLHQGADVQRCSLVLGQQAVTMNKEISSKAICINEAPSPLKRADVTSEPMPNPVRRSQKGTSGDLLGDCSTTVIKRHIKLHHLTCP
jgi:hypothetical protein